MQSTTCLHDGVANTILQKAYLVFHHPIAFHTANGVFNTDSDRRDRTIGHFRRWSEFTPPRFFLRLDDGDTVEDKTLDAQILVEATAVGQGRARALSQALIMRLPFIRGTQEADGTGLLDHEEVLARMALLLAAVVVLLVLGSGGAVERSLRAIMPNRGVGGPPVRRVRREHCGTRCGGSGRKPLLVCSSLIQHGMQSVNPCVRMRLAHPKELSLHFLKGMLCHIRQNDEPFIGYRG
jgi:hypothetical protein